MEKKLRTIDYELEQTEKRLEDLLTGIKQLRKEVHEMLPPQVNKVVHERGKYMTVEEVIDKLSIYPKDMVIKIHYEPCCIPSTVLNILGVEDNVLFLDIEEPYEDDYIL